MEFPIGSLAGLTAVEGVAAALGTAVRGGVVAHYAVWEIGHRGWLNC